MNGRWYLVMAAVVAVVAGVVVIGTAAKDDAAIGDAKAEVIGVAAETTVMPAVKFGSEMDKVSYVLGMQIGTSFKTQQVDVNTELFARGMQDALAGRAPALSQDEVKAAMMAFQQRMMAKQMKEQDKMKADAPANLAASTAFLEANKAKEGVKVLASGLQYKVLTAGTGATPGPNDSVKTHYRGTLIDGTEFDSSYKRGQPVEFPVKGVIAGWTEALQLMKEGGKWQLFIPAELAYGEMGRPSIPANSALIFDIELIEVVK